jgi:pimeloyl-ACP methyl ester carboxylesterase
VVGHSLGANVALEMVAAGEYAGPLVLLSPSFSRKDESKFPRALDHLGRVLGHLPFAMMLKIIGPAMKSSLPPDRRDALIAELRKNDPRFLRRQTRQYLEYLDRHGSLAPRLCDSGVPAWVVFGEHDDIGLTDPERETLEACPDVTMVTISDAGHSRSIRSRVRSPSWSPTPSRATCLASPGSWPRPIDCASDARRHEVALVRLPSVGDLGYSASARTPRP